VRSLPIQEVAAPAVEWRLQSKEPAVRYLTCRDVLGERRADEALELVVQRRRADGRWHADGYWWRPPGSAAYPDVVDWGRRGPNEMVTLNALRVLRMADRPVV
jgi:hypothetical protein